MHKNNIYFSYADDIYLHLSKNNRQITINIFFKSGDNMEIILHIDLRKLDKSYDKAIDEYFKRTSSFTDIKKILYKDFSKSEFKKRSYRIVISYGRSTISSVELAKKISDINIMGYSCIEFIITADKDYIENLTNNNINNNANNSINDNNEKSLDNNLEILNLTTMHLGTDITAVALAEQIYRAYTINNNISYHK